MTGGFGRGKAGHQFRPIDPATCTQFRPCFSNVIVFVRLAAVSGFQFSLNTGFHVTARRPAASWVKMNRSTFPSGELSGGATVIGPAYELEEAMNLLSGPIAYVAAVLPALPIIGIFVVIGRYLVEETDEYLRDQFVRKALIASGFTLSVATAWGFLENFDLVPHVYAYYAAILWFAGLGLGACFNKFQSARGEA